MKLNQTKIAIAIALVAILMPQVSHASGITDLKSLVGQLIGLVNTIIPLLFGIALIAFMWGVIKYLFSADPKKITEARSYLIFSIIAIAVMLSTWSLALLIKNSIFPSAACPVNEPGCSSGGGYFGNPSDYQLRLTPNGNEFPTSGSSNSSGSSGTFFNDPGQSSLHL